jgi:DNA polymerase-3 subunit epsilon
VCTARLARRVVWEDVRNVRLQTLAEYFRSPVRPVHRALPDAEACAHVLHGLLEFGGRLGILTLGDLHESVRARGRPHYAKIRLADRLPHARGVYLFRGRDGRVLYVGKATDLRSRVKSYFYGDDRRKVGSLLAQTAVVEGRECRTDLEALVAEARLIAEHEPAYNRRGRTWRRFAYLKVDTAEAWPRIKVVRTPDGEGTFLGPFAGAARARMAKEALEDAFAVRRCTRTMGASTRFSPCMLADLGRCAAPCDGRVTPERYEELVRGLILSLSSPGGLLEALEARMDRLAEQERFEEAALVRDRLHAVAEAIARGRAERWLLGAGRLVVRGEDGVVLELRGGTLGGARPVTSSPCPPERVEEIGAVRTWMARHRPGLIDADRPLAEPVDGGRRLHDLLARLREARRAPDRRHERTPAGALPPPREGP